MADSTELQRPQPMALLRQHSSVIAKYALFRWGAKAILHALVHKHGMQRGIVSPKDIKTYMGTDQFAAIKVLEENDCIIAIHRFKEASELAVDTSAERIDLVALQKKRIQGFFVEELESGHMNKQLRYEIKLLSDILAAEDKKNEGSGGGNPFDGVFDNAVSQTTMEYPKEA